MGHAAFDLLLCHLWVYEWNGLDKSLPSCKRRRNLWWNRDMLLDLILHWIYTDTKRIRHIHFTFSWLVLIRICVTPWRVGLRRHREELLMIASYALDKVPEEMASQVGCEHGGMSFHHWLDISGWEFHGNHHLGCINRTCCQGSYNWPWDGSESDVGAIITSGRSDSTVSFSSFKF